MPIKERHKLRKRIRCAGELKGEELDDNEEHVTVGDLNAFYRQVMLQQGTCSLI